MSIQIEVPYESIIAFCEKWKISEFAFFGSVLRDDFQANSDIDVLVSHTPDATWTLFDRLAMIRELETLFGRKVDMVTRKGLERSKNYLRRKAILQSAQVIHAA